MLRYVIVATALVAAMAQGPAPKPESRESSYAGYEQQYQPYPQQYSYQPAPSVFSVDKLVSGLSLPSSTDIISGIVFIVAVAGFAGVVLIGIALVLKLFSLKIPLIKELKQKVISNVDKVDARMLESAWKTLTNSLEKFQFN